MHYIDLNAYVRERFMITLTEKAAEKVKEIRKNENLGEQGLRVRVVGGGCSGFQYGFAFDENISDDDLVVIQEYTKSPDKLSTVKLVIDPLSLQYLEHSEVDYKEDLQGSQFIIRNPNAKTTCGCGSSFSIDDGDD